MTPQELIHQLPMIPYVESERSFVGMDCFGLVEIWHKHILGIEVTDRKDHPGGSGGLLEGFEAREDWITLLEPENHSVAIMKAIWGEVVLEYGHCGMIWEGRVYHFKPDHGFQHSPVDDRQLRITEIIKHNQCKQ